MPIGNTSIISNIVYRLSMSIERKNPLKRDQALNDATGGQMGEQPRPQPSKPTDDNLNEQRQRAARKMSRDL
jgi:hypothetical protein